MRTIALIFILCAVLSITLANDVNRKRIAKQLEPQNLGGEYLFFTQLLDHFTQATEAPITFTQRYLVNDSFWGDKVDAPVFLVIEGEGEMDTNSASAGSIAEYAKQYGALVFALEHRYYGASVPPSPYDKLDTTSLAYLTSNQALADLANFETHMIAKYNLSSTNQWVAFGCSYAGVLSAWYRLKYPHLVAASSSGSSPVEASESFYQYDEAVSAALDDTCASQIRAATTQVEKLLEDEGTAQQIKNEFGCGAVADNVGFLYALADIVAFAVQYNSSFGYVPEMCHNFTTGNNTVQAYIYLANLLWTRTPCVEWDLNYFTNETVTPSDNMRQWMWQSCNEFGYFQVAPAQNSLRSTNITVEWHRSVCAHLYGQPMIPKVDWTNEVNGAQNIQTSNTVFTNGDNDPWRMLSVVKPLGPSVPSIIIDGASHCANWRGTSPSDSASLKNARVLAGAYLNSFIHTCANNCHDNGVCVTRKTGDTTTASQCVCYDGFTGDSCQNKAGGGGGDNTMTVPWWSIVITGIGAIVIGIAFGFFIGRRKKAEYNSI